MQTIKLNSFNDQANASYAVEQRVTIASNGMMYLREYRFDWETQRSSLMRQRQKHIDTEAYLKLVEAIRLFLETNKSREFSLTDVGTWLLEMGGKITRGSLILHESYTALSERMRNLLGCRELYALDGGTVDRPKVIWRPDQSLPYVLHRAEGGFLDGSVIIKPEVVREIDEGRDRFVFLMNRGHQFNGSATDISLEGMTFSRQESDENNYVLRATVMTEDEFIDLQREYEKRYIKVPGSREALVEMYLEAID